MSTLGRIIVFVADVERCGEFYARVFGMTRNEASYTPGEWLELSGDGGGATLAFHKAHGPDGPINAPNGSEQNPHKLVFVVEDVDAERARLIDLGVEMGDVCRPFDGLAFCDGADPEGHRFQISSR